ncbi:MAG: heme biosynthesis HemY N-terminal domain-containing protein [Defluviicoccus sp.]|nr:heme biosynthesis HemY N-terminal domain-containing protein [Defluviicoccus sp.]MDG4593742.1 heme biosynthesis HemY N-terminal domain-containing protein [Defluviicoccus sp.]
MIRWLVFLILTAVLAVVGASVARAPGQVTFEWQGYHIETTAGVLILALIGLVIALLVLDRLFVVIGRARRRLSGGGQERRQRRGYEALSRGLVAVAAGDASTAGKQARRAASLLDNRPLTMLLSAQAAQLQGDDRAAADFFSSLRTMEGTQFLGLRGLLNQAMKREDWGQALSLAEEAHRLNPKSEWVVSTLFDLQKRLGRWRDAEATFDEAVKLKLIPEGHVARERAEIVAGQSEMGGGAERLRLAAKAFKADPSYTPAAVRYVELLLAEGDFGRAASTVERAWEHDPEPELAELYWRARRCDDAGKKLDAANRLAKRNPENLESRIVLAAAALEARAWDEARATLTPVAGADAVPRVCRLMAALEEGENGDLAAARTWLMRAAGDEAPAAPPTPPPAANDAQAAEAEATQGAAAETPQPAPVR